MRSYASHGVQCGVTTSHYTCCVRDYHLCYRLFALSSPSVPTLFERSTKGGGWHSSAGSSSDGRVFESSNSKNRENPLLTNDRRFLIETR